MNNKWKNTLALLQNVEDSVWPSVRASIGESISGSLDFLETDIWDSVEDDIQLFTEAPMYGLFDHFHRYIR